MADSHLYYIDDSGADIPIKAQPQEHFPSPANYSSPEQSSESSSSHSPLSYIDTDGEEDDENLKSSSREGKSVATNVLSNSSDNPRPPRKRKKKHGACVDCQWTKRECDMQKPRCSRCIEKQLNCTYDPAHRLRAIKEDVLNINENIRLVEMEMRQIFVRHGSSAEEQGLSISLDSSSPEVAMIVKQSLSSQKLLGPLTVEKNKSGFFIETRVTSIATLYELIKWLAGQPEQIQRPLRDPDDVSLLRRTLPLKMVLNWMFPPLRRGSFELNVFDKHEERELVRHITYRYFNVWERLGSFAEPFFHFDYKNPDPHKPEQELLITTVCTFGARYALRTELYKNHDPKNYTVIQRYFEDKAYELLPDAIETNNIETVLAIVFLALDADYKRLNPRTVTYFFIAVRMAFALGIHEVAIKPRIPENIEERIDHVFKRTLWSYVLMGESAMIACGIHPVIQPRFFNIPSEPYPDIDPDTLRSWSVYEEELAVAIALQYGIAAIFSVSSRLNIALQSKQYISLTELSKIESELMHIKSNTPKFVQARDTYKFRSKFTLPKILRDKQYWHVCIANTHLIMLFHPNYPASQRDSLEGELYLQSVEIINIYEFLRATDSDHDIGDNVYQGIAIAVDAFKELLKSKNPGRVAMAKCFLAKCYNLYLERVEYKRKISEFVRSVEELETYLSEQKISKKLSQDLPRNAYFDFINST